MKKDHVAVVKMRYSRNKIHWLSSLGYAGGGFVVPPCKNWPIRVLNLQSNPVKYTGRRSDTL